MMKWIKQMIQRLQAKGTKYDSNYTRTDSFTFNNFFFNTTDIIILIRDTHLNIMNKFEMEHSKIGGLKCLIIVTITLLYSIQGTLVWIAYAQLCARLKNTTTIWLIV